MPPAVPIENARRATLAIGEVLVDAVTGGRFHITGFVGKGGMGEVYRAVLEDTGTVVALKTIPLALADDPRIAARAQRECSTLLQIRHENVVGVSASGVRPDGVMFMVMDFLEGMTLLELRRRVGRIPIAWSLEIMRDVCRGLEAVHAHAVHRDVKPANVHFDVDAQVRVLDLGAARWNVSGTQLTSTGMTVGTPAYMAPEVLDESAPVDGRADLWSVGVILYELLAGRHPFAFEGRLPDNGFVLGNRIIHEPHTPLRDLAPLCPGALAQLVDGTLAKAPRDRPRWADELERALSRAMEAFAHEHGAAPPLDELAARAFPGAPRQASRKRRGAPAPVAPPHLVATAPLGPAAPRAQPTALPYLRTAGMPASGGPVAGRSATPPPPPAALVRSLPPPSILGAPASALPLPSLGGAPALALPSLSPASALPLPSLLPASALPLPALPDEPAAIPASSLVPPEREPPRVSDVFLRQAPAAETALDPPAPPTAPEAIPAAGHAPRPRAGVRRTALVVVAGLMVAAGLAAAGLGAWAHRRVAAPAVAETASAAASAAPPPAAPSAAPPPAAPSAARSAAPPASSPPRHGLPPRLAPARPGR
jgi:serine/threonine-protein kinase